MELCERLGAVASLKYEGFASGDPRELLLESACLAGEDERWMIL
jgi:hypothetical protein